MDNALNALALIYASTSSNVLSFDIQSALANGLRIQLGGTPITTISTSGLITAGVSPATADNSLNVATTAWVNSQGFSSTSTTNTFPNGIKVSSTLDGGSNTLTVYSSSSLYNPVQLWRATNTGTYYKEEYCDEVFTSPPTYCYVDWISPASASSANVLRNGWTWRANSNFFNAMTLSKTGNLTLGGTLSTTALTATNASTINGISVSQTSSFGVNIGVGCIPTASTGSYNFCMGYQSLYALTSGENNIAVGAFSGIGITNQNKNTAIGSNALRGGNAGVCTAIGANTLYNGTGFYNVAIGSDTLNSLSTGANNTMVGTASNTSGNPNNCSTLGYNTSCGSYTQSTAIGCNATATASNQIVLGTNTETVVCPNKLNVQGQPFTWYLSGNGGNSYTPAGRNLGSSFNVGGYYWNSVSTYGGASSSNWDTTNAIFTAPSNGLYCFQLGVFNNGTGTSGRWLQAQGTCVLGGGQYLFFDEAYLTSEGSFTQSLMYYMTTGQTFYFNCPNQSPQFFYANGHTTLQIIKIY